jgi:hypothetical protein
MTCSQDIQGNDVHLYIHIEPATEYELRQRCKRDLFTCRLQADRKCARVILIAGTHHHHVL